MKVLKFSCRYYLHESCGKRKELIVCFYLLCYSFTMSIWLYIENITSDSTVYPLLCTSLDTICLTVDYNGNITATHGAYQLQHSTTVKSLGWTNIIYRYNAEG